MSSIALALVAISVVAHVAWNFLGKRGHPSAGFFLVANTFGSLCLLPFLWWHAHLISHIGGRVWLILLATGIFQALYFASLAGAYRTGDLSIAYPIARSFPAVFVALSAALVGTTHRLTVQCLVGIGLVVIGGLLIPLERFGGLTIRHYLNPCCGFALLAAVATAGYSRLDSQALGILRGLPEFGAISAALVYAPLEGLCASIFLAVYVLLSRRERRFFSAMQSHSPALFAGLIMYFSYTLVLVAMSFVSEVSYLVAFRQLSVPLGALVGVVLLDESGSVPKFLGVGLSFAGLVLVATD